MRYSDEKLKSIAAPVGLTEETKCKNAIHMVRDALKRLNYTDDGEEIRNIAVDTFSYALNMRQPSTNREITILVQGSYANKTNIPSESDVDVAVILESTFRSKYRTGITREDYGFTKSSDTVQSLKDNVEKALKEHFAYQGVERHDKCIKVIGNTYRVDADVVPAYRHRDYTHDYTKNKDHYIGGIEIHPDSGGEIINYPEQHIKNGIQKNKDTGYRFKKCVRIIKNIREDMQNAGYIISPEISSFGLESLLWNIPNEIYVQHYSLGYIFSDILSFLMENLDSFSIYREANGIKFLFSQYTKEQAYVKFLRDLNTFFEY